MGVMLGVADVMDVGGQFHQETLGELNHAFFHEGCHICLGVLTVPRDECMQTTFINLG